jgi:hypothetical protein
VRSPWPATYLHSKCALVAPKKIAQICKLAESTLDTPTAIITPNIRTRVGFSSGQMYARGSWGD